jgi:starch synthase (maltosyl-transferring)
MALVNRIRRENPALQTTWNIHFAETHNDRLLCYGKTDDDKQNRILVAVNLDSEYTQGGWIKVPLNEMGISSGRTYFMHDLLTGQRHNWNGEWNRVELNPHIFPVSIFKVEQ